MVPHGRTQHLPGHTIAAVMTDNSAEPPPARHMRVLWTVRSTDRCTGPIPEIQPPGYHYHTLLMMLIVPHMLACNIDNKILTLIEQK